MPKTPQEMFQEREKRFDHVLACRKPDRVPVFTFFGTFAAEFAGVSPGDAVNNFEKNAEAHIKAHKYFEPDMGFSCMSFGAEMAALDCKIIKWPGYNLPDHMAFQFVEEEYMKAEEYDQFLYDPTDFIMRVHWPRIFGKFAAFGQTTPWRDIYGYGVGPIPGFLPFATPAGLEALEAIKKAAEVSMKDLGAMMTYLQKLAGMGYPNFIAAGSQAPFDLLGDFFRGTKGLMLDMFRRPEKVLAAVEKLLPWMIETGVKGARMSGNPRVFIPLHKGQEGFLNPEQFRKFYWPTFQALLQGLAKEGLNPVVLVEGSYTSRLDIIKDVPEGKIVYWFEHVDLAKAKEALGGKVCIMGSVPMSLMVGGTPDQVRACCKEQIDIAGKDGGYIMSASAMLDGAKPDNVKAMVDFTKEYGVY